MTTADHPTSSTHRDWRNALGRGFRQKCPNCGHGAMFRAYLKVSDNCANCGEALHHHEADDAPPYFTIFIVGHIVIPLVLVVEKVFFPPVWLHFAIWIPLTIGLSLVLLPLVKGALVAYQWALRMHGFGDAPATGTHDL